jgi:diguanylate cyclase (GGDEF)-like protein
LFVNNQRAKREVLKDGDRVQVGTSTILKFCYQDVVEETFQKRLYESATRDPLVRTYNRQYLLDSLDAEFSYCSRNGLPLAMMMIDIDHFKPVNDRFGHLAGDYALREVAALIQKDLRSEDVLARYGGEEFAVLLRHADADRALAVAERIRRNLAASLLEYEGEEFSLTVSIGVATLSGRNHATPLDLVRAADGYLYRAKQAGRNRTVCAASADAPSPEPDETKPLMPDPRAAGRTPARATATTVSLDAAPPESGQTQEVPILGAGAVDGAETSAKATSRRKSGRSKNGKRPTRQESSKEKTLSRAKKS